MVGKRLGSRVKAAVIGAVMTASVFISPAAFSIGALICFSIWVEKSPPIFFPMEARRSFAVFTSDFSRSSSRY